MPVYKDGIDISIVEERELWLGHTHFHPKDPVNANVWRERLQVKPQAVTTYLYLYAVLPLPIGTRINSVTFYGYNGDVGSIARFKVYRLYGLDSGLGSEESKHDSNDITGASGDAESTWTPSPSFEIVTNEQIVLEAILYSGGAFDQCYLKGAKIIYEG